MARKTNRTETAPAAAPVVEMPAAAPAAEAVGEIPTWTLTAAERFDLLALHSIVILAEGGGYSNKERLKAMQAKLREFELYEETHHR